SHYKSENWFYPIHIRHFFSGADEARMFRMNYESGNLFEWLEFAPDNESVFIRNAAFVDTPLMLKAVRAILPEVNWIDTVWNYEEFLPENGNWSFRGQQFSHLIFS